VVDLERKVQTHLVITLGFSRRNAEIAIEMFRSGELNNMEEEVINKIMLNPESDRGFKDSSYQVANHLNHRITLAGGDAKTPSPRHRRK
jgi:hypothetical protein